MSLFSALAFGCFNPDNPAADTDSEGTTGATSAGTAMTTNSPTTADSTGPGPGDTTNAMVDSTSVGESSSGGSETGGDVPDWGEGDPPDLGDLGPDGEGNVLVVHALDLDEDVDVWLVGDAEPVASDLSPDDAALLEGIPRDARRVVLARAGTLEAVACSDWFPLLADEQWAVVAARDTHTCPAPSPDGGSVTFEQDRPLSGNPVRFAHAGAPDDLTVVGGGVPKAGTLSPLMTLSGDDLPDCSISGCSLAYQIENAGLALTRDFTFLATEVADVPPAGEVLLITRGDLRQDWPTEPDALRILRVDIDGTVRRMDRDPEVAAFTFDVTNEVSFTVPAMPGVFTWATVQECQFGDCVAPVQRFTPGMVSFGASQGPGGGQGSAMVDATLEAGHRYLLAYTNIGGAALTLIQDDFDRSDLLVSTGRAFNTDPSGDTLTIGREFGGNPVAFDAFVDVASLAVTAEEDMPVGGWSMLTATAGGALGTSCFYGADSPAGWRGLLGSGVQISVDTWPPVHNALNLACF
ncbi:MAG: hypothetical protein AAF721_03120 [Myxococcota bacterium]